MPDTHEEDPRIGRTREAVLEAVAELIIEGGWDAVTHVRVAERSGYARSTVYRHWPQRTDFLRDVSDRAESMSHADAPTGGLRDDLLSEIVEYRNTLFDRGGGAALAALLGVAEHDADAAQIRSESVRRGEGPLRNRVAAAAADQELSATVDPLKAASGLFGPVTHLRLMSTTRPTDADLATIVDGFIAQNGRT